MKLTLRAVIIGLLGISLVALVIVRGCRSPRDKGQILYELHCESCHGKNGEGFYSYPPIAGADYLETHKNEVACMIYYGMENPIVVNGEAYHGRMLGNTQLTEVQIANLANYIFSFPGNSGATFNQADIQNQLENCSGSVVK